MDDSAANTLMDGCRHCWHMIGQHTDQGCGLSVYCGCSYTETELLRLT